MFGADWLFESWKMIQEDRIEHYRMLTALMPLARTPMDKKGAASMRNYERKLLKELDKATPWRQSRRNAHLRGKVEPGKVVVILDANESPDNPLYAGASITRG